MNDQDLVIRGLAAYPRPQHRDGSALFNERYAAAFFAKFPVCVGKSYQTLKSDFPDDPILRACHAEFLRERLDAKQAVGEWEKQWPDAAAHKRNECLEDSRGRYKRKVALRISSIDHKVSRVEDMELALSRLQGLRKVPAKVESMLYEITVERAKIQRMEEGLVEMEARVQSWYS